MMTLEGAKFDLSEKVALVTGASRGLGLAIATGLGSSGAAVTIVGRSEHLLAEAAKSVEKSGAPAVEAVVADIAEVKEIERVFKLVEDKFGRLDILINNAGFNVPKPSLEITEEEWEKVLAVNLKGTFFCCKEAAKLMLRQGKGKIVNIASQLGLVGAPERAPYCASKGGVIQLTRSLAVEWARWGINVNAVAPTFMRTEMTKSVLSDSAFYASVISKIPLGRVASPEDIVGGVLYLVSEASDMVTGHVLSIDGGWTAW